MSGGSVREIKVHSSQRSTGGWRREVGEREVLIGGEKEGTNKHCGWKRASRQGAVRSGKGRGRRRHEHCGR